MSREDKIQKSKQQWNFWPNEIWSIDELIKECGQTSSNIFYFQIFLDILKMYLLSQSIMDEKIRQKVSSFLFMEAEFWKSHTCVWRPSAYQHTHLGTVGYALWIQLSDFQEKICFDFSAQIKNP